MTPSTATPAGGAPATPAPDKIAALEAQVAQLQGKADQADEFKRTAEFWHGKATAAPATPKPAAAADSVDDDEADLLDIVASKGAKGLDALLAKRGFVKAVDVAATVNAKVSQVESEQQLVRDYPDLKDKNSEFFKDTADAFGRLKASGVPEGEAMVLAAERTALAHIRAGKMKTPSEITAEAKATRETARLARVAAQASSGGGRGAPTEEEGDDELTPEQRRIAVQMLGGNGVSDEDAIAKYTARAKKGVAMSTKK